MSNLKDKVEIFTKICSKGHALSGKVKFCPFCGLSVESQTFADELKISLPPEFDQEYYEKEVKKQVGVKEKTDEKVESIVSGGVSKEIKPEIVLPEMEKPKEETKQNNPPNKGNPGLDQERLDTSNNKNSNVAKDGPSRWKWILIVPVSITILFVLFFYVGRVNKNELACNESFNLGLKYVAAGDFVSARNQGVLANASCIGELRAKADALQAAITKDENNINKCQRNIRSIANQLEDNQLTSARNAIDQLELDCSKSEAVTTLRTRLTQGQILVKEMEAEVRTAIAENASSKAKAAINKLEHLNRENPDLPQLKTDITNIVTLNAKENETVLTPDVEPKILNPLPIRKEVPPVNTQNPVKTQVIEPPLNAKSDLAKTFLIDAEDALNQRKFDAAKTYIESARRIDPNNSKIEPLSRLIRERERQILQQETTIK